MNGPLTTENPPNILEAAQAVNLFTFRSTMLLRRPFYDEKHFFALADDPTMPSNELLLIKKRKSPLIERNQPSREVY